MLSKTFQIERLNNMPFQAVHKRILWVLNDLDYKVISHESEKNVIFEEKKIKWRGSPTQVEEGTFEITESGTVKLTYTIFFTIPLIMLAIILVIAIAVDPGVLFLAACLIFFSVIHFFTVKYKAKALLLKIVDENIVSPD